MDSKWEHRARAIVEGFPKPRSYPLAFAQKKSHLVQ